MESEAVRLFVDRATLADREFSLGPHTADVSHICRRLEGIPLAIELAAAMVRSAVAVRDQRASGRPPRRACRRSADGSSAPADAPRGDRLELRPAVGRRAPRVRAPRGLQRRLHGRCSARRHRVGRHRHRGRRRPRRPPRRPVAARRARRQRGAALPDARHRSRVRDASARSERGELADIPRATRGVGIGPRPGDGRQDARSDRARRGRRLRARAGQHPRSDAARDRHRRRTDSDEARPRHLLLLVRARTVQRGPRVARARRRRLPERRSSRDVPALRRTARERAGRRQRRRPVARGGDRDRARAEGPPDDGDRAQRARDVRVAARPPGRGEGLRTGSPHAAASREASSTRSRSPSTSSGSLPRSKATSGPRSTTTRTPSRSRERWGCRRTSPACS